MREQPKYNFINEGTENTSKGATGNMIGQLLGQR